MKIRVHADDLGATERVSGEILRCADDGALDSASLLVNAPGFEFAVREYERRRSFSLALHLNLIEGKPLSTASRVTHLVNGDGFFRHTASSLWSYWLRSLPSTRRQLRDQVRLEMTAQLELFRDRTGDASDGGQRVPIEVDSHGHAHLVPFVFDEIVSLAGDHGITRVRILNEPWGSVRITDSPRALVRSIKSLALARLSGRYAPRLERQGLRYPEFVVGVAHGGQMTLASVARGLAAVRATARAETAEVEILFHPGGTDLGEDWAWTYYRSFGRFYRSAWRKREGELLQSEQFSELLRAYRSERI